MTDREKARHIVLEHLYMIGARSRFEADQPLGHHQVVLVDDISDAVAEVRREAETKIQEARDEIVKLRKALHAEMMGRPDKWHAFIAEARDEALEEAARVADGYCTDRTDDVAAAIRALKGTVL